jgi:para-nitrobenzyl esterase
MQPPIPPSPLPLITELQSEDCLYLNVWAPPVSQASRLPVIIWFHPGAYQMGSGSQPFWQGDAWARAGAVFVSFNHRLGKLGFLAHPELSNESEDGLSGNYGLMDQLMVLRWVRDNIGAFGGDPECVTIFGASSGASSVSLLMAMPQAAGLFHRAIAESGGAFGPSDTSTGIGDRWQTLDAAVAAGAHWASGIGALDINHLRAMSAEEICRRGALDPYDRHDMFGAARPIIDGQLVPESPVSCFARRGQIKVPLLTGSAANEAMGMGASLSREDHVARAKEEFGELADQFLDLYPAETDEEAAIASRSADGDRLFTWQNWTMARLHADADNPTYYYQFDHAPPVDMERSASAFHTASIFYGFQSFGLRPQWEWNTDDQAVADVMRRSWLAFARSGSPNCNLKPDWMRFYTGEPKQMRISADSGITEVSAQERKVFWDRFYADERAKVAPADQANSTSFRRSLSSCN